MTRDTVRCPDYSGLIIPAALYDRMLAHCRESYPDEACGLIAGAGDRVNGLFEMTNTEPSPISYFMDPKEQFIAMKEMREKGLQMVGIFHSHPQSPPYPSPKDVSLACYDEAVYIIVSLVDRERPEVKAFSIVAGKIEEVPLVVE
ncbi:MAG: M67 family metallopeptidase [Thermodesulfovibrionales bacterium]